MKAQIESYSDDSNILDFVIEALRLLASILCHAECKVRKTKVFRDVISLIKGPVQLELWS